MWVWRTTRFDWIRFVFVKGTAANDLHFFNIYVHTYIVIHFLHSRQGSVALSESIRLEAEMVTCHYF